MKTFIRTLFILVAIAAYIVGYNATNSGSTITASALPKESISIKIFGEKQNGSITLVKITHDEKKDVVKIPYTVYKPKFIILPPSNELVDGPLDLEPIPTNGITPLVIPELAYNVPSEQPII